MSEPTPRSEYLTAREAARLLGVKIPSLYSYVSRGLIRSVTQPGTRARLYFREDVERAATRMGGRAGIPETVESAVRWGQPVLTTSITDLSDAGPRYRGRPAIALAQSGRSFESVAELLWTGVDVPDLLAWEVAPPPPGVLDSLEQSARHSEALNGARLMSLATSVLAMSMSGKPDFERGTTAADAARLISLYACAAGLLGPRKRVLRPEGALSIAQMLARGLLAGTAADAGAPAINAALVVCADHELSPATFAARVAASAGADLGACLQAAIVTHSGIRFGSGCDRAEDLLRGVRSPQDMQNLISSYVSTGRQVPGFNPVSYPKGDPRARYLIELASSLAAGGKGAALPDLPRAAAGAAELHPRIDVGLVGLSMALGLPRGAASAIWMIGRSAGWAAHAIEQRLAGFTMRPRAKYLSPV
ncbi:citrate synthase [Pigmentiphaga humi]|uniref:citrate synthase n=1 Tax=Pigmentiphaga humi TaxID=2478468 RepID=UPI00135C8B32|nr:citrate synthase [Pigmentiphaga humi]